MLAVRFSSQTQQGATGALPPDVAGMCCNKVATSDCLAVQFCHIKLASLRKFLLFSFGERADKKLVKPIRDCGVLVKFRDLHLKVSSVIV